MLNNKQFIFGGVVAVLVSVVTLTIVFLPNSFEPDIVYQKSELATVLPIIPSVAPALVVPEIEVAAKTTEIEESTEEPDFDREEKKAKLAEIKKSKKKDQLLVPVVPFYSQFSDITSATWQKVGCGIASLAMLIEYYNPGVVTVDTLLEEGIAADADGSRTRSRARDQQRARRDRGADRPPVGVHAHAEVWHREQDAVVEKGPLYPAQERAALHRVGLRRLFPLPASLCDRE